MFTNSFTTMKQETTTSSELSVSETIEPDVSASAQLETTTPLNTKVCNTVKTLRKIKNSFNFYYINII